MTSLPVWRISIPIRNVITAELVAAAPVIALAQTAWWAAAIIAVATFAVAGLHYRGATAIRWLTRAARRGTQQEAPEPFAVELPDIGTVGMRWDGQYVITAIALHGQPFPMSTLIPEGVDTDDVVPLDVIAGLMRQFGGLELHSVDVVSAGSRVAADGRYTPRYDEIVGDRPAVGTRRSWLILRLCPQTCLRALAYRGDVDAAAAAATERIRQAVIRAGCRATICGTEQFEAVTETLLGGHQIDRFQQHWTHLRADDDYITSYRVAGRDLTNRLLGDIWAIRSTMTATMLRLTPSPTGPQVAALVRLHTAAPLTHPPLSALQPVMGQQLAALYASLPLGNRSMELPLSPRALQPVDGRSAAKGSLLVPVGPSGLILGMDSDGVPLLMPFTDPLKFAKVAIDADVEVVAALLLRASAAGLTVVVDMQQPDVWGPICDDRMVLSGTSNLGQHAGTPSATAADGEQALKWLLSAGGERGCTLIAVTGTAPPDCDVVITQMSSTDLVVQAGERSAAVTIMRPRNETQFLNTMEKK